jgi:hypothetical protein
MRNNHAKALHEGRSGQFRPKVLDASPKRRVTREEWEKLLEDGDLEEYWPDELEEQEETEDGEDDI